MLGRHLVGRSWRSCSTHVCPPQSEIARTLRTAIEKHISLMLCLRHIMNLNFCTLDAGTGGLTSIYGVNTGADLTFWS